MPKPELGKVAVGDRLLVIPATYSNRFTQEPVLAAVAKKGRVWLELVEVTDATRPRIWKLNLNTQDAHSGYSQVDRFVTPEQYAWEQHQSAVYEYLRKEGVLPDSESPWRAEDRMVALANLLRAHDGLDPI